jgi:uncharacterized protein YktA (UPF0223 family)
MKEIVFLLEEPSAKEVLQNILPQILPKDDISYLCISHQGKHDLEKSIPRKLRAWNKSDVQFVIVHDKDSADCRKLKQRLLDSVKNNNRPDTLVRIVCSELESWFLGDLDAVEKAFSIDLSKKKNKALYRDPDAIGNAKEELKKLVRTYQEIAGSQSISKYMNISQNKSHSFQIFVSGVRRICGVEETI